MLKLLVVRCSPRKGGNTDIILDLAAGSAEKMRASVRKIELSKLKIRPCQGCLKCLEKGICGIRDDVALVFRAILDADITVIGSPVYFGNIPSQLKALVDRAQKFWVRKYIHKEKRQGGRKKGLFFLAGFRDDKRYLECSSLVIGLFFKVMDIDFAGSLYVSGTDLKGDVRKNKAALRDAKNMVKKVIKGL